MFIRQNQYVTGDYSEADVIPLPDEVKRGQKGKPRKKREYLTKPEQQNLNDRNSFRWLRLCMQGNFFKGDHYFTLTYQEGEIPSPDKVEDAKKDLTNFLRKCRDRYRKIGKELKYIWVMEYQLDDEGQYLQRVHFHVVMNAGISRDELEECWSQRQERCTIILTRLEGCFINSLEVSSIIEGASFLFTESHKSF